MAYMDFHPTIHEMGDEACAAALIDGSIEELTDYSLQDSGTYRFTNIIGLKRVSFPMQGYGGVREHQSNTALEYVFVPKLKTVNSYAFLNCVQLRRAHFPESTTINSNAFEASGMEALILSSRRWVANLSSVNAFTGTPIEGGNGYIYVPKKMDDGRDGITAYEAATNWSSLAGQFRYIEDYPEILAHVKEQTPWY